MINTAIVGLGWWGKTLVKAARDFGAPLRFVRGVTLEPESVRDFAAEHQIALGTSLDEVLADKIDSGGAARDAAHQASRAGGSDRGRRQAFVLRKTFRAHQGRCA